MGTMSRFDRKHQRPLYSLRSTKACRLLTGDLLRDVLAVIRYRTTFSRQVRRIVQSLWRKHAKALRLTPVAALHRYSGVVIQRDSVQAVAARILTHAGRI